MATFPTITQSVAGPLGYFWFGGNITNHEVFAFTLQSAPHGIGALISDVTVFLDTDFVPNQVSYEARLTVVDEFFNPTDATIVGNFESTGV